MVMVKIDMDAIRQMSVPDRVQLAQDIWDSLQPSAEELPLTEAQRRIVNERLAEHDADPSTAISWDELQKRVESTS